MTGLFNMPKLADVQREINFYRTPLPNIDSNYIERFTKIFQVDGKVREPGSRIVVKDRSGELEIFVASGSVWWTKRTGRRSESRRSVKFNSEKRAAANADSYLEEMELSEKRSKPISVTYTETVIERKKGEKTIEAVTHQHVNYGFSLDGLPVWGSGAKIQITYGENNQIVEALKFWRETKKERKKLELISIASAIELFKNHEYFTDLSEQTASVHVNEINLGYYALPPRETQFFLTPVFQFIGYVSTENYENYDFDNYVLALAAPADDLKKMGVPITEDSYVI